MAGLYLSIKNVHSVVNFVRFQIILYTKNVPSSIQHMTTFSRSQHTGTQINIIHNSSQLRIGIGYSSFYQVIHEKPVGYKGFKTIIINLYLALRKSFS